MVGRLFASLVWRFVIGRSVDQSVGWLVFQPVVASICWLGGRSVSSSVDWWCGCCLVGRSVSSAVDLMGGWFDGWSFARACSVWFG